MVEFKPFFLVIYTIYTDRIDIRKASFTSL